MLVSFIVLIRCSRWVSRSSLCPPAVVKREKEESFDLGQTPNIQGTIFIGPSAPSRYFHPLGLDLGGMIASHVASNKHVELLKIDAL